MKYYKCDWGFGEQPNNIIPPGAEEITKEEYDSLMAEFERQQAERDEAINSYVQQVSDGVITLDDVPEEYRDTVNSIVNPPSTDPEQAWIDSIVKEVAAS